MPSESAIEVLLVGVGTHLNGYHVSGRAAPEEGKVSPKPKDCGHEDLGYSMRRWLSQRPEEEGWWQNSTLAMTEKGSK